MDPKQEWLRFSAWDRTAEERWLRDKVASLFDLPAPTEAQQRILHMASLRLTLQDLPSSAYPTHEAELRDLINAEFGPHQP